jgi:hypothetical protein
LVPSPKLLLSFNRIDVAAEIKLTPQPSPSSLSLDIRQSSALRAGAAVEAVPESSYRKVNANCCFVATKDWPHKVLPR